MNENDSSQIIDIPSIGKVPVEQLRILLLHLEKGYDIIKRYREIEGDFRTEKMCPPESRPDDAIYNIYDAIVRESKCEQLVARDMMLKHIRIFFSSIQR